MNTTYTVEYYNGVRFKGQTTEAFRGWGNLMLALGIRKRDSIIPNQLGSVKWDNVTIIEWKKDGSKEVIRENMEQF